MEVDKVARGINVEKTLKYQTRTFHTSANNIFDALNETSWTP